MYKGGRLLFFRKGFRGLSSAAYERPRGGLVRKAVTLSALGGAAWAAVMSYRDGIALTLARIDGKLRPHLQLLLPHSVFVGIYSSSRPLFLDLLARGGGSPVTSFPCPTTVLHLRFRGDLGNSAGLDKEGSLLDFNYDLGAGFAVVGTVLNAPHLGNVFPMWGGLLNCNAWTPLPQSGGAVNSLGLPGHGVDVAITNIEEFRRRRGIAPQAPGIELPLSKQFPIGVSIMGHPLQEGKQKLDGVLSCVRKCIPVADFIEINESCPNVAHGSDAAELALRLSEVTKVRDELQAAVGRRVPILVKLGTVVDADETVKLLVRHGIDGMVALNTQRDYSSFELPGEDQSLLEYYTSLYGGGLSGRPIRHRSLKQVTDVVSAVRRQGLEGKFVVVHVGGVSDAADVQRSRRAGSDLRQWYTGMVNALAEGTYSRSQLYPSCTAMAA